LPANRRASAASSPYFRTRPPSRRAFAAFACFSAARSVSGSFEITGQDDITEDEAREALLQLDPLWDELFPAEQARIVQLLVERVDLRMHGVEVRLRPNGLTGLVREVAGSRRAA
jgi:site-specific DNA recombinase